MYNCAGLLVCLFVRPRTSSNLTYILKFNQFLKTNKKKIQECVFIDNTYKIYFSVKYVEII